MKTTQTVLLIMQALILCLVLICVGLALMSITGYSDNNSWLMGFFGAFFLAPASIPTLAIFFGSMSYVSKSTKVTIDPVELKSWRQLQMLSGISLGLTVLFIVAFFSIPYTA